MTDEQRQLFINFYLNWFNNYVSITGFALDVGLSYAEAKSVLDIGKRLYAEDTTTQRMVQASIVKQS
jgi:hypothetical protein